MRSDHAIWNGTSIFVGIIVSIAAFARGALLLPLLLVACSVWGLYVLHHLRGTLPAVPKKKAKAPRRTKFVVPDIEDGPLSDILLLHVNQRITAALRTAGSNITWEWATKDPLAIVKEGGRCLIRVHGLDGFESAEVVLDKQAHLRCELMHHTSTPLGYIMLYIDESQLSRYIFTDVSFGEGSNFLLIDAAGNVVSSQNAELLGEDLADPDADGVVIANWYCVNGTLVVNFTDAANDRAIAKCLRESDFSDLTFDKVYLNGAAVPTFFADKQVADKPADAEITYSASWILLKDSDGFSQTVTMLDAPTRVKISKADITTHEEIPGATLRVLDKNGNVVDEWVSENTPHYIEAVLVAGETYTLEETLVPDGSGYVPANSIRFTVEDDGKVQHVFMQDDYTKVQISKTDIATGKEISGAKLKITNADGKTIAEWVTDGTPHYMERIPMGTYTLTETTAPTEQGYVRAESITFEVGPTGDIQRVEMKDDFTKVEISKADMTDGRELPGAKLKITDASGSTIAEWDTNGQPHRIERLKPGEYTLTETAAPAGYLLSEEVHFTVQETGEIQEVTMYDAPAHSLILTKRDIATNAKLADARLTIRDAYGTTIDRWTTTDGDHAIRVLPECSAAKDPHKNLLLLSDDTSEHVYTMVEELAPNGYLVAESITFKVMQMNDNLVVFIWQDSGWQKSSEGSLAMYDERTDTPVPLMKTFPQTGSIL